MELLAGARKRARLRYRPKYLELPKIHAAQAAGCAPVVNAILAGEDYPEPVKPDTIAKSIAIGNPADGYQVVQTVKATGGTGAAVSDEQIVDTIKLLARTVPNLVHTLQPGSVLVTPCDRSDVVLLVAMAALNSIPIAGLILTGDDVELPRSVLDLCAPAFATGLPVLRVASNSWGTVRNLSTMSQEIPSDDLERLQLSMSYMAEHIDADTIARRASAAVAFGT